MKITTLPLGLDHLFCQFINPKVRKVVCFVSPSFVIKVTKRHPTSSRETRREMVVTYGAPNYEERKFIKLCVKAGEKFPIRKLQFKFRKGK